MSEWQPIETAPKDGRLVVLLSRNESHVWPVTVARWARHISGTAEGWKGPKANWASDGAFTHWLPLPALRGRELKARMDIARAALAVSHQNPGAPRAEGEPPPKAPI